MTAPFTPQQGVPAPRDSRGYVQMGGGYSQAVAEANGQPALPMPVPPQIMGGYPASNLPPAPQPPAPPVQQPPQQPAQQPAAPQGQFAPPAVAGQLPPQQQAGTLPNDPGIPPELRGKTLAEAFQLYNGMKRVITNGVMQPPVQVQQQMQTQPAPQPPQVPQQQGQQPDPNFWRNPAESINRMVAEAVQQTVAPMLAPITQQTLMQGIQNARDQVAAELGPQFAQVESSVMEKLRGADPRMLANPQLWKTAAAAAIGEAYLAARSGQPGGTQVAPAPISPSASPALPQQPAAFPPAGNPVPTGQYPPMNQPPTLNAFFTEAPSSGAGPAAPSLSSQELWMAQEMGMSPTDYLTWKTGVTPNGRR